MASPDQLFKEKLLLYHVLFLTYDIILFYFTSTTFEQLNLISSKSLQYSTQLMSMIFFYVFLTAEFEYEIRFSPTCLDFTAHKVTIF